MVKEEGFIISEISTGKVAKGSYKIVDIGSIHYGIYKKNAKGEYASWNFVENVIIDADFIRGHEEIANHLVNIIYDNTRGDATLEQIESNAFYYSKVN